MNENLQNDELASERQSRACTIRNERTNEQAVKKKRRMGERHAIVEQRKNRVASFAESLFFSFAARSNSMISLFLRQDCIGGSCRAFCKAKERCVQNCVDGRCPMRCVSHQCQQSCQVGACSLKCRTGKDCDQQCSSDCPLVSCHSKEGSCKQVSKCIKCCFQL